MDLRIIFIIILLAFISASSAESQLQTDNVTYPSVKQNIVIIIDASGSTAGADSVTGLTFIGLIDANAINIIQNIVSDSRVGVVAFGGAIAKTDLLSMGNEANKAELDNFIRDIGPKGGDNPTDLDKGLLAAEDLLNSVNCTKNIIILSDGIMPPEEFDNIKKVVEELKNKGIKMHFVQVLTESKSPKVPNKLYYELAQAADGQVMVLYPDERVSVSIFKSEEPCSIYTARPTITPTTTEITTPTPIPTPQLEHEVKELKERLNKVEERQNQSWFESSIKSVLDWFKSIL